jgi:hypothetical protein
MWRARADDSFTWEPFDHGRQRRIAVLLAVGLCAGAVGLVIGRMSSGGSVESARVPSAVTTKKDQAALATTPVSPPVVLANPVSEHQTSRNSHKQVPPLTSEPMPLSVHPERQSAVRKQGDKVLPPASPPVVLLNPGTADFGEKAVSEKAREHQNSPGSTAKSEKKNEQETPPAQIAPRVVQRPVPSDMEEKNTRPLGRQQNHGYQSNLPESRAFRSGRPATFADYNALRDYMMRR